MWVSLISVNSEQANRETHITAQSQRVLFQGISPEKIFNYLLGKKINLRSVLVVFVFYSPFKYILKIGAYTSFNRYTLKKLLHDDKVCLALVHWA